MGDPEWCAKLESAHKVTLHAGGQRNLEVLQPLDVVGQVVLAGLVRVQLGVGGAAGGQGGGHNQKRSEEGLDSACIHSQMAPCTHNLYWIAQPQPQALAGVRSLGFLHAPPVEVGLQQHHQRSR